MTQLIINALFDDWSQKTDAVFLFERRGAAIEVTAAAWAEARKAWATYEAARAQMKRERLARAS